MKPPIILSLFDFSGNWPTYFRKNGYRVIQVDESEHLPGYPYDNYECIVADIMKWEPTIDNCYGILAAPPCTHFSNAGSRLWKIKDQDGRTEQAIKLIKKTLTIIKKLNPNFWILENPVGRIPDLITELGKPKIRFNPYDYAGYAPEPNKEKYTKRTCLWGNFKLAPKNPVLAGRTISELVRNPYERAITPLGFAYATYLGNKCEEYETSRNQL